MTKLQEIIKTIRARGSQKNVEGMKRFGIVSKSKMYGVGNTELKKLAKKIGRNHELALELWNTNILEARILAAFVDDPKQVTEEQMEKWAHDFDNWALCDTVCGHLFDRTPWAYKKISEWAKNDQEFVRRAAFAMIAWLAVHDKKAEDKKFLKFFPIIKKYATDERNFVRKAVNWALRQIGKRNSALRLEALNLAEVIGKIDSKAAHWIAKDAIRELNRLN